MNDITKKLLSMISDISGEIKVHLIFAKMEAVQEDSQPKM